MIGMIFGTGVFASLFDVLKGFYLAGEGPQAQTIDELLGIPTWAALAILIVIAGLGFKLGSWFERRHGGALSAEELNDGDASESVERVEIVKIGES